jgi:hypothetical protein
MTMKTIVTVVVLALAACNASEGQRCNPLEYSNSGTAGNCGGGLQCIYPTAPNCGVAYCCAVDEQGNITDKNPNCQADPSLDSVCMLDLSSPPTVDMTTTVDMSSAD